MIKVNYKDMMLKYNNKQQQTYNTFPAGSTDQLVTFPILFSFAVKWEMEIFMHWLIFIFTAFLLL
jgi:hypothetical protein